MGNLAEIRNRFIPILKVVVDQYDGRVPGGYPHIVDNVNAGMIGLEIDPNYALYITEDNDGIFAELYRREPRLDSRATASRQKYGGAPNNDRRRVVDTLTDQELRNLVAELKTAYNMQPALIYTIDN
jgi:hypothetical protein